ncbi:MAG: hypothetical protein CVU59_08985 [Deltaproteobacteria bacterium HGW-Deltaproteobacteria-17]|nr:MAG: hypothetical protein CVU59_08985 [Deltaproteobacteria bacterium HGW-Deltaproteobacteria-17]
MLEKRNLIRRNLTGGLALGLFTGLLLALPDAITGLFAFPGLSMWGSVVLLFFFDGVITAGMLGFVRGLFQTAAQKFAESGEQSRTWMLWSRRTLAAVWASSIMPSLPLSRSSRWFVALGLALAAAWVLPGIIRVLGGAAEDRRRKGTVILAAGISMGMGFACTSTWGAVRLFPAPGFWFLTGFFLHLGALFYLARMIRTCSRYHATWLSPLAGPGVVSIVLLLSMLGGSFARTRLEQADPARLKAFSRMAHRLHGAREEAASPKDADREVVGGGEPPAGAASAQDKAPPPAEATLQLDFRRSILIVTSTVAPAPVFEHGFRVTGGVATSSDPALSLGSFLTGRHLGVWARVAPHWPAPGPVWHQAIAAHHRVEPVRYGRFDGARTAYFRELPDFGFPEAFEPPPADPASPLPTDSPLEAFLRTTDLISRPFFAWVHLDAAADPRTSESAVPDDATSGLASRLQKSAIAGRFVVIWLHLPKGAPATVSVFDPERTAAAVDFKAPFSVAGVLPSLVPVPGHRTEFSSSPFPEVHHPRVVTDDGLAPVGTVHDVRRLTRRIRHLVDRRPSERWPSSPEKLVSFLDQLICRGQLEPSELRRITARVRPYPDRLDLTRRMDLLMWRMGRLTRPPVWAADMLATPWLSLWRHWTHRGGAEPAVSQVDPRLFAWTLALSGGGLTAPLLEVCPGVPHTLPLPPGL